MTNRSRADEGDLDCVHDYFDEAWHGIHMDFPQRFVAAIGQVRSRVFFSMVFCGCLDLHLSLS